MLTDDEYRAKLLSKAWVTDSGCWEWTGYVHPTNYGQVGYRGKAWGAHRLAWHLFRGPIPPDMDVCHTCDNKPCINPDHLWLGTHRENVLDVVKKGQHYARAKTHCPAGHAYDLHGYVSPRGHRNCKLCHRIKQRIAAGWPEELARSLDPIPHGKRVVNARYSATRKKGKRQLKTHCKYGHPFSGDNLYISTNGRRRCRACQVRTVTESTRRWADRRATSEAGAANMTADSASPDTNAGANRVRVQEGGE